MGLFNKERMGDGVNTSPVKVTLTWNALYGNYSFFTPDKKSGGMRNLKGMILEPTLYKVTGKGDDDSRVYSNLCMRMVYDKLKVYHKPMKGSTKLLAEGNWRDIQETVKAKDGKWTSVIAVMLLRADVAYFEGEKLGEWEEDVDMEGKLAFIQLRGDAIRLGWSASFESLPIVDDNSDGCFFTQNETIEVKGRKASDIWLQPFFDISQPDEDNKKHIALINQGRALLVETLNPYLETLFKTEVPVGEDDDDEGEEAQAEAPNPLHPKDAASKPKSGHKIPEADDDLPF